MRHIGKLAVRILFLKGDVEMQTGPFVQKIKYVKEMLKTARKMEEESVREYNIRAKECSANNDAISRQLFETLATDEEMHYDQYNLWASLMDIHPSLINPKTVYTMEHIADHKEKIHVE